MSIRKLLVCSVALLSLAILSPALRADDRDQATQFTFSQPVRVPGRTLPAGTYWFQLLDRGGDQQTVGIYNSDRRQLITVVHAFNSGRVVPSAHTLITLAEPAGPSEPAAVVAWFYPGETVGHQFAYPAGDDPRLSNEPQVTLEISHSGPVSQRAGSRATPAN